ncbi:uncharacterized protein LOC100922295 isoform X2 [Sarcophilus harrisii]|uniref:uncharacterized protein LOC100922295 isoform X2 n=1 Tax=Sarcophilus harrisii TaxID=9305 RepID=UPI001301B32B|nr:uncharacterized protein LOC100922295 isoform X2 [Sarcophilus harrisii]
MVPMAFIVPRGSEGPQPGNKPNREPSRPQLAASQGRPSNASRSLATLPEVIGKPLAGGEKQIPEGRTEAGPGLRGAESHPGGDGLAFTGGGRSGGRCWAGSREQCLWRYDPQLYHITSGSQPSVVLPYGIVSSFAK